MTKHPCRVCGNRRSRQLNRHHLIGKEDRVVGTPQRTIKLCKDKNGCQVHKRFHAGDHHAAVQIRRSLSGIEMEWMIDYMGAEWVKATYPFK